MDILEGPSSNSTQIRLTRLNRFQKLPQNSKGMACKSCKSPLKEQSVARPLSGSLKGIEMASVHSHKDSGTWPKDSRVQQEMLRGRWQGGVPPELKSLWYSLIASLPEGLAAPSLVPRAPCTAPDSGAAPSAGIMPGLCLTQRHDTTSEIIRKSLSETRCYRFPPCVPN